MTPPQTPWQKAASQMGFAGAAFHEQIVEAACHEHAAHLEKENVALRKDRDCWIFNANELQKAFNKLEKENAELKAQVTRMRQALTRIACFHDDTASKRLIQTGSFASFDEPCSVEAARTALLTDPTPESK